MTIDAGKTVSVRNYALVENADVGVDVIALDSCVDLREGSLLFLHQTQAAGGALAGRYAYVTVNSVTTVSNTCLVQLKTTLTIAFRTGLPGEPGERSVWVPRPNECAVLLASLLLLQAFIP